MSPKTSSHSTQLTECTPCIPFLFLLPLLCFSYDIPSYSPHHTSTSARAPFLRLLKYFTCGHLGRVGGPGAPQMRGDRERAAQGCMALQSIYMALFSINFCCNLVANQMQQQYVYIYSGTSCSLNIHLLLAL